VYINAYWRVNADRRRNNQKQSNVRQQRNREFISNYLATHPCVDCGEGDSIVLEFDHLRDKTRNVSDFRKGAWSIARIQEEIAKCEVRCANCHRRKTHARRGEAAERLNVPNH